MGTLASQDGVTGRPGPLPASSGHLKAWHLENKTHTCQWAELSLRAEPQNWGAWRDGGRGCWVLRCEAL